MSLLQTIENDLKESLKQRNSERTGVLRMLKNAIKNRAIADRVKEEEMPEEQIITVLRQEAKKRKESIIAFTDGGRSELAEKEKRELALLEPYLPPSMSEDEIVRSINDVVSELKLQKPYAIGQVMGLVMKKLGGRADGNAVREQVQKFISTP